MLEQARALYQEYQNSHIENFYGKRRKVGFVTRVKNLARKLDLETKDGQQAMMYLDCIAVKMNFYIELRS